MRTRIGLLAGLLTAGLAPAPATAQAKAPEAEWSDGLFLLSPPSYTARGQSLDYEVPRDPHPVPLPLYHDRPETGGIFVAGEFIFWRGTNPLGDQIIAEWNGVGSGEVAVDATLVDKEGYVPGWHLAIGYRFRTGLVVQVDWYHLHDFNVTGGATLVQDGSTTPPTIAFLYSRVTNFTQDFIGQVGEADGIWQSADEMTIKWTQRFEKWNLAFRVPLCETECNRSYGLAGFTHSWIWERFKWRTVDRDAAGNAVEQDVAIYTNILSQPMYGFYCGCGTECFFGQDCKSFALTFDVRAGLLIDFARNIVRYERGDFATGSKRARRDYNVVPEFEGQINLWWYPIEGMVFRVGYDAMAFVNTVAIPNPVNFNFLGLDPEWERRPLRVWDGWNLGVGFIF